MRVKSRRRISAHVMPRPDGMSSPAPASSSLPQAFVRRRAQILSALAVPASQYEDLSPKGSIDEGVRGLIDEINAGEGFVTTSSCAGRLSVFLEGHKTPLDGGRLAVQDGKLAGVGGKGAGGRWLFVSHDPVGIETIKVDIASFLGMKRSGSVDTDTEPFAEKRLIHFKFEPMVRYCFFFSVSVLISANLASDHKCLLDPPRPDSVSKPCPNYLERCPPSRLSGERCCRPSFCKWWIPHADCCSEIEWSRLRIYSRPSYSPR